MRRCSKKPGISSGCSTGSLPGSLRARERITPGFRIPSSGHLRTILNHESSILGSSASSHRYACGLVRGAQSDRPNWTQIWARKTGLILSRTFTARVSDPGSGRVDENERVVPDIPRSRVRASPRNAQRRKSPRGRRRTSAHRTPARPMQSRYSSCDKRLPGAARASRPGPRAGPAVGGAATRFCIIPTRRPAARAARRGVDHAPCRGGRTRSPGRQLLRTA